MMVMVKIQKIKKPDKKVHYQIRGTSERKQKYISNNLI